MKTVDGRIGERDLTGDMVRAAQHCITLESQNTTRIDRCVTGFGQVAEHHEATLIDGGEVDMRASPTIHHPALIDHGVDDRGVLAEGKFATVIDRRAVGIAVFVNGHLTVVDESVLGGGIGIHPHSAAFELGITDHRVLRHLQVAVVDDGAQGCG